MKIRAYGDKNIEALREEFFNAGKVPIKVNEATWAKFKESVRKFNRKKNAFYKGLKKEQYGNLQKKLELIKIAEDNKDSSDFETTILRATGVLYQEVDENTLSNLYNVEMVNKTIKELPVSFKITSPPNATLKMIGQKKNLIVPEQGMEKGSFFIELPKTEVKGHKNKVVIEVYSGERLIDRVKTNFVGPIK